MLPTSALQDGNAGCADRGGKWSLLLHGPSSWPDHNRGESKWLRRRPTHCDHVLLHNRSSPCQHLTPSSPRVLSLNNCLAGALDLLVSLEMLSLSYTLASWNWTPCFKSTLWTTVWLTLAWLYWCFVCRLSDASVLLATDYQREYIFLLFINHLSHK